MWDCQEGIGLPDLGKATTALHAPGLVEPIARDGKGQVQGAGQHKWEHISACPSEDTVISTAFYSQDSGVVVKMRSALPTPP